MSAPLPDSISAPSQRPPAAHTGLWFDKFCHEWSPEWKLDSPAKLKWIQTVTGKAVGDEKLLKLLAEHTGRLNKLAHSCGGQVMLFKTLGRFATGLGREHPIENGFVWHPAFGMPFLPGSSVKGIVRAWASTWTGADKEIVARIFGPRDLSAHSTAHTGSVIFFDAIPTRPVQLAADVMTPHYGPYYEDKSGRTAPGDWHSPVPIPFLTVSESQSFLFALAPRTASVEDSKDCKSALKWLVEALLELGAGAKTAVGYGRFVPDKEADAALKKTQEAAAAAAREAAEKDTFVASLANLSLLARELMQAARNQKWECSKDAFVTVDGVENWLAKIEADAQPDAIQHLHTLFDLHFPGLLADPDRMRGKKNDQPAFKDRWRNLAKRLNCLTKP